MKRVLLASGMSLASVAFLLLPLAQVQAQYAGSSSCPSNASYPCLGQPGYQSENYNYNYNYNYNANYNLNYGYAYYPMQTYQHYYYQTYQPVYYYYYPCPSTQYYW